MKNTILLLILMLSGIGLFAQTQAEKAEQSLSNEENPKEFLNAITLGVSAFTETYLITGPSLFVRTSSYNFGYHRYLAKRWSLRFGLTYSQSKDDAYRFYYPDGGYSGGGYFGGFSSGAGSFTYIEDNYSLMDAIMNRLYLPLMLSFDFISRDKWTLSAELGGYAAYSQTSYEIMHDRQMVNNQVMRTSNTPFKIEQKSFIDYGWALRTEILRRLTSHVLIGVAANYLESVLPHDQLIDRTEQSKIDFDKEAPQARDYNYEYRKNIYQALPIVNQLSFEISLKYEF